MQVFLIHGLGRTVISMALLARRLRKAGYPTRSIGYVAAFESLDRIAGRLVRTVEATMGEDDGSEDRAFAVVGHSLGNVITRLASPRLPTGFRRFAMLAPPNRPPAIARKLGGNPLFEAFAGDAGRKLVDPEFFDALPRPDVPSLVVAGTFGPQAKWLPYDGRNDGIVSVEETRLEEATLVEVSASHTFLMNRHDVLELLLAFFEEPPRFPDPPGGPG